MHQKEQTKMRNRNTLDRRLTAMAMKNFITNDDGDEGDEGDFDG